MGTGCGTSTIAINLKSIVRNIQHIERKTEITPYCESRPTRAVRRIESIQT
jgi:hypothetical protein